MQWVMSLCGEFQWTNSNTPTSGADMAPKKGLQHHDTFGVFSHRRVFFWDDFILFAKDEDFDWVKSLMK